MNASTIEKNLFIRKAKPTDSRGIYEAHMRSIREVCAKDYSERQIAAWGNRGFRPGLWEANMQNGSVWVVEATDGIKGLAYLKVQDEDPNTAEVMAFYFTKEIVGKGFGRGLMEMVKAEAHRSGAKRIVLSSTKTAKAFYEAQGFVQNGPDDITMIGGEPIEGHPMVFELTPSLQRDSKSD